MKILLLAVLLALCSATTLTYRMAPHEKACFHTTAKKVGEKMAFYFAVQQGGNFDIDFEVLGPSGNNIGIAFPANIINESEYNFLGLYHESFASCFGLIIS